jgi:hypothetical protein
MTRTKRPEAAKLKTAGKTELLAVWKATLGSRRRLRRVGNSWRWRWPGIFKSENTEGLTHWSGASYRPWPRRIDAGNCQRHCSWPAAFARAQPSSSSGAADGTP